MKHALLSLFVVLGLVVCASRGVFAQSASVDVDITLASPAPSCSLTGGSTLGFGTAEKPASGSASVTISATTGARSSSGTSSSGTSSVGQVRLSGTNVAAYTVSRTFPGTLTRSGGSLSYAGTWAQSGSSASGYSSISGSSYSGASDGAGSSFSRYFRFGGTVSGITLSDPSGVYDAAISASASCN